MADPKPAARRPSAEYQAWMERVAALPSLGSWTSEELAELRRDLPQPSEDDVPFRFNRSRRRNAEPSASDPLS